MTEYLDNNEGTGFEIDDDLDFDTMFSEASQAAEDEDTSKYFDDNFTGDSGVKNASQEEHNEERTEERVYQEPQEEPSYQSEEPVYQEPRKEEPVYQEPLREEPVCQEPQREESAYQTTRAERQEEPQKSRPKIHIPSIEDQIIQARRILNISDTYRKLSPEERSIAGQFISGGDEIEEEFTFIVRAINADPMLARTMIAATEAKSLTPVERAFYVIDLDNDLLESLGSLLVVFTEDEFPPLRERTKYARVLVKIIDELDQKAMSYIKATVSVLKAAEL